MSSGGTASPSPPDVPEQALEWGFNPWRERPGAAALAVVVILGLCLLVIGARQSLVLTLALCLAGAGTLAPAVAPQRCRMDAGGAARRGPLGWERRMWGEVRRAALRGAGVFLSPYSQRHWLDPYRGLFLPLPSHGDASLREDIRRRLNRHGL